MKLKTLQFFALDFFDREHVHFFVAQGFLCRVEVAHEAAHAVRFERGRMVGSLPGAIEREVPFDELRSQYVCRHINGDAVMMARKAYRLHLLSMP